MPGKFRADQRRRSPAPADRRSSRRHCRRRTPRPPPCRSCCPGCRRPRRCPGSSDRIGVVAVRRRKSTARRLHPVAVESFVEPPCLSSCRPVVADLRCCPGSSADRRHRSRRTGRVAGRIVVAVAVESFVDHRVAVVVLVVAQLRCCPGSSADQRRRSPARQGARGRHRPSPSNVYRPPPCRSCRRPGCRRPRGCPGSSADRRRRSRRTGRSQVVTPSASPSNPSSTTVSQLLSWLSHTSGLPGKFRADRRRRSPAPEESHARHTVPVAVEPFVHHRRRSCCPGCRKISGLPG